MAFGKLAKKTDEFHGSREQYDALRSQSAEALHQTFPFLDPDRLAQLVTAMPEGGCAAFSQLKTIHPSLVDALVKRAVDDALRPYFDALRAQSLPDSIMAGFKLHLRRRSCRRRRKENDAKENSALLFFFFLFPLAGADGRHSGLAAWEATTGTGRATYFFRTGQAGGTAERVEGAMRKLTQGLALENFRREPIYRSDDSLAQTPQFHRYAIGCRKLPVAAGSPGRLCGTRHSFECGRVEGSGGRPAATRLKKTADRLKPNATKVFSWACLFELWGGPLVRNCE